MRRLMMVLVAFLVLVPLALGSPILTLTDGTNTVTCAQGGTMSVGCTNSEPGVLNFFGSLGVWNINVTTGLTKPAEGSALLPVMHLNSVDMSKAAGHLVITFSDDLFGPLPYGTATETAKIGPMVANVAGSTMSYFTYLNNSTVPMSSFGPYPAGSVSGDIEHTEIAVAGTYSLTQRVEIEHAGAGTSSFDAELRVSEPGSLLLLGCGLLSLGAVIRRRV